MTNTLHYLVSGIAMLRFHLSLAAYFIPVVLLLRSLRDTSDREIYTQIIQSDVDNVFLSERAELNIRMANAPNESDEAQPRTRIECLSYLGMRFRHALRVTNRISDIEAGRCERIDLNCEFFCVVAVCCVWWTSDRCGAVFRRLLLQRYVLVHLPNDTEKFDTLMYP